MDIEIMDLPQCVCRDKFAVLMSGTSEATSKTINLLTQNVEVFRGKSSTTVSLHLVETTDLEAKKAIEEIKGLKTINLKVVLMSTEDEMLDTIEDGAFFYYHESIRLSNELPISPLLRVVVLRSVD